MTSEIGAKYSETYVWVWLPTATEPVVAGLLSQQGRVLGWTATNTDPSL